MYYMIVKSYYLYGHLSVRSKKKERLMLSKENYAKFADKLDKSSYAKQAKEILEKVNQELKQLEEEEIAREQEKKNS